MIILGPVTRDGPAEILVSATSQTCRDMSKISEKFWQFCAAGAQATKFFYCIGHMIIRHLTKIAVTTVTFQSFGGPRDA
jgi:hypothetical protein